jgi:hypothetical protein
MFNKQRSYRYLDKLQEIADGYNVTPHRSLNYTAFGTTPREQQLI